MFKKATPLKKPDDFEHAYGYALFVLNLSMRTEGEMREKMLTRGYLPKIVEEVITRLRDDDKYIDDVGYIESYIDSMKRYKYYGAFMMKKRLYLKKLPKDLIEEKMAELVSREDELEIATRYVEKNFGKLEDVEKMEYDEKQKIMRRLLSRGFGFDVVKKIVNA